MTEVVKVKDHSSLSGPDSVEKHPSNITGKEHAFAFLVFVLIGTTSVIGCNFLLNMLPSLVGVIFPGNGPFTDTLTPTHLTVTFTFIVLFSKIDILRPWVLACGMAGSGLCCLALAFICNYASVWSLDVLRFYAIVFLCIVFLCIVFLCIVFQVHNASLILHIYCGFLGFFVAVTVNCGYGIAARFPRLYVGGVGAGFGASGIESFTVWMFSKYVAFGMTRAGILKASWMLGGIAAGISVLTIVLYVILLRRSWVEEFFGVNHFKEPSGFRLWRIDNFSPKAKQLRAVEAEKIEANVDLLMPDSLKEIGYLGALKLTSWNHFLRFFSFFQSYIVFPAIGPMGWGNSIPVSESIIVSSITIILISFPPQGAFQFFDFTGRFLPNVIPALIVSERNLTFALAARSGLVLTFILSMKLSHLPVFGAAWFHLIQIIIMASTGGWASTVATIQLPRHVDSPGDKSAVSSFGGAVGFLGVVAGQWSSKLIKVLLK